MADITGKFNWQVSDVIPSFVQGEDAKIIFEATEGIRTGIMDYGIQNKLFYGSTPFVAAKIDTLVRPLGLRVANLKDMSRPEVMGIVKGRHYSDTPTFVVRSASDSNNRNLPILNRLMQEAEIRNVALPFMVTGFDVIQDGSHEGYGLMFVPRDDFAVVNDERLDAKYHGKKFTNADEIGLPNFDENGSRTWYARNQGVSRLCLDWNLNLGSDDEDLADSGGSGRVVLVSGGATAQNLMQEYRAKQKVNFESLQARIREEHDFKMAKLQTLGREIGLIK